jgi:hypothetical protein
VDSGTAAIGIADGMVWLAIIEEIRLVVPNITSHVCLPIAREQLRKMPTLSLLTSSVPIVIPATAYMVYCGRDLYCLAISDSFMNVLALLSFTQMLFTLTMDPRNASGLPHCLTAQNCDQANLLFKAQIYPIRQMFFSF